ncbi:PKD domain-containing protein [Ferruginibacter sp.]
MRQITLPLLLILTALFADAQTNPSKNNTKKHPETHSLVNCNNWLSTPTFPSLVTIGDLDVPGNQITVEGMVNRTSFLSNGVITDGDLVTKHTGPSNVNYILRTTGALITTSTGFYATPPVCDILLNKTYHFAMVYNGSTLKFYRNGFLMSQVAATGTLFQNDLLTAIGLLSNQNLNENLVGYINEIRIWNVARTQAQIQAYMNTSLPNPTTQTGLLAYYTFDDLVNKQGNTAWNGTLVGSASINNTNPSCTFVADSCEIPALPTCVFWPKFTAGNYTTPIPYGNTLSFSYTNPANLGGITAYSTMTPGNWFTPNPTIATTSPPNSTAHNVSDLGGITIYPVITGNQGTISFASPTTTGFYMHIYQTISTLDFDHSFTLISSDGDLHVGSSGPLTNNVIISNIGQGVSPDDANATIYFPPGISQLHFTLTAHPTSPGGDGIKLAFTFPDNCLAACGSSFDYSYKQNTCNPLSVQFFGEGASLSNPYWSFGDNSTTVGTLNPTHNYTAPGNYLVRFTIDNPACNDTISKTITVNVVQDDIVLTPDTTICAGATKLLRGIASTNFCWSPTTYLNDATLNNPTTSTPSNITYYYTAEIPGPNLITNGDFSLGNTGFTSDYVFQASNTSTNAAYGITTNAQTWNTGASPCMDHTSGTGNMFVANGATTIGKKAWKSGTIAVTPNTNYQFSAWIQTISLANFAVFKFYINGLPFGLTLNGPNTACQWVQQKINWNSGNNTTVDLSLEDFTYDANGNDFALDDISFTAVTIKKDSVKITVETPVVNATGGAAVCSGTPVQLNASGASSYSWSPATGLSNPNIANPVATVTSTTNYTVSGTTVNGCTAQATVTVAISTAASFDFTYKQDVCNPLSVQFTGAGASLVNPYWSFGDAATTTGTLTPTHTYTTAGNYLVRFTVNNSPCNDTISKMITVGVVQADIVLTPDTTICPGTTKLLRAVPSANFCWTPTTYLNDPTLNNPTTNTPVNITYYHTAEILGNNIIINGDFSAGNTGFTSGYNYAAINTTEGEYFVGTSPQAWNASLSNCPDHTNNGGNMLLVNGAPVADVVVWKQQVTVTPNTNYSFSTWIQALYPPNPAQLSFSINGISVGNLITASLPTCTWKQFFTNWNSGNNTTASISIVNKNTIVLGNDFALDDISFAPVLIKKDSVKITVDNPSVNATSSGPQCQGIANQLNATGAATYSWLPVTGLSNPNIANPLATPAVTTTYTVSGISSYGCPAGNNVTVVVMPKPVITKSKDTTICKATSVTLFATGGNTYLWSPAATLSNPNIPNPVATPVAPVTKYYVTVTNTAVNLCSTIDSVQVTIKPDPVFAVSPAKTVCQGTPVQLLASGGDTYSWLPANLVSDPSIPNPLSTATTGSTNYSVTVTESTCKITSTLFTSLVINPKPVVTAIKSNDINCAIEFTHLLASGATDYTWTPATGLSNAFIANPIARPVVTTQYVVSGKNAFGCAGTDTLDVTVTTTGKSGYHMPNSFTPNNDGLNDCFGISYWGIIEKVEFFIYNRYGERVFYTNDPLGCWNGMYKGVPADQGNYVYYIKAITACGPSERKGNVVLLR